MTAERGVEPWRRRLYLPAYTVSDAARYSRVAPQTVSSWTHRRLSAGAPALPGRGAKKLLSYLELVEVAVVSVFRKLGVSLAAIARTREYMQTTFSSEYPFAAYTFKTDGARMLLRISQLDEVPEPEETILTLDEEPISLETKVIVADAGGQLGWEEMMADRLAEFDYEYDLALVWHVAGRASPVKIDPRFSFGAPTVGGIPTWILKGRWDAGESLDDIVEDFGVDRNVIIRGLEFEKITVLR